MSVREHMIVCVYANACFLICLCEYVFAYMCVCARTRVRKPFGADWAVIKYSSFSKST